MRIDSLRLKEGGKISNLTLPTGVTFPPDENLGEVFYIKESSAYKTGIYICEYNEEGVLVWRMLLEALRGAVEYPVLELGNVESIDIYSDRDTTIKWTYQGVVNTKYFEHSTIFSESSRIYVKQDGIYQIAYNVNSDHQTNHTQSLNTVLRVNSSAKIGRSSAQSFRDNGASSSNSATTTLRLYQGDYIELVCSVTRFSSLWLTQTQAYTVREACGISIARLGDL